MNIKTKYIAFLILIFSFGSCLSTGNPQEDIVITRIENVKPEILNEIKNSTNIENPPGVIIDINTIPNPLIYETVQSFMKDATVVVFTERQYLKSEFTYSNDPSEVISLTIPSVLDSNTEEPTINKAGVINSIASIASAIYPPIQGLLPLLALLPWAASKRSRKHFKDAIKKAVPTNGSIDISGSIIAISKALGFRHTSENPEDLERAAKKLRVKIAAKNGNLDRLHSTLSGTQINLETPLDEPLITE